MPDPTRRSLLVLGVGVAGATAVQVALPGPASAALRYVPTGLRRSTFLPARGKTFVAATASRRHRLELAEVADVPPSADEYAFNLLFRPLDQAEVPDGIYRLSARGVPACTLFLSPVRDAAHQVRIQALVNARP